MMLANGTAAVLACRRVLSRPSLRGPRAKRPENLAYGEGVEAQVLCWNDCLFHGKQRVASGRRRHLRGDPSVADRRGRLPVPDQELKRSLRTRRQGKPTRSDLK